VTYSNEKALAPAGELQQKMMALRDKHGSLVELEKKLREKNEKMPELDELDAYREKVLVSDGTVDITVKLLSPVPSGWLDRALNVPVPSVGTLGCMGDIPSVENSAKRSVSALWNMAL
jgi:hypothetical protein